MDNSDTGESSKSLVDSAGKIDRTLFFHTMVAITRHGGGGGCPSDNFWSKNMTSHEIRGYLFKLKWKRSRWTSQQLNTYYIYRETQKSLNILFLFLYYSMLKNTFFCQEIEKNALLINFFLYIEKGMKTLTLFLSNTINLKSHGFFAHRDLFYLCRQLMQF